MFSLRIDTGYLGGAAHSGTSINSYGNYIGVLYIIIMKGNIFLYSPVYIYIYPFDKTGIREVMNFKSIFSL